MPRIDLKAVPLISPPEAVVSAVGCGEFANRINRG